MVIIKEKKHLKKKTRELKSDLGWVIYIRKTEFYLKYLRLK